MLSQDCSAYMYPHTYLHVSKKKERKRESAPCCPLASMRMRSRRYAKGEKESGRDRDDGLARDSSGNAPEFASDSVKRAICKSRCASVHLSETGGQVKVESMKQT